MARALIVFYSRTGVTRRVAQSLAKKLDADLLPIEDVRPREGMLGYLRSVLEAENATLPDIVPVAFAPEEYDLVVFGTPVWAGHVSSPMRRFLHDHAASQAPRIAFFCTFGGSGTEGAFRDMRELAGREPEATCALRDRDVFAGNPQFTIDAFATRLGRNQGVPTVASQPSA
ncbi:MAG TPA: flavodoxin [Rhodanobacteraceae bacterium]|jgi:flavodoxin